MWSPFSIRRLATLVRARFQPTRLQESVSWTEAGTSKPVSYTLRSLHSFAPIPVETCHPLGALPGPSLLFFTWSSLFVFCFYSVERRKLHRSTFKQQLHPETHHQRQNVCLLDAISTAQMCGESLLLSIKTRTARHFQESKNALQPACITHDTRCMVSDHNTLLSVATHP